MSGRSGWTAPRIGLASALALLLVVVSMSSTGRGSAGRDGPGVAVGGSSGAPYAEGLSDRIAFPSQGSVARDFTLPLLQPEEPWIGPDSVRLSEYAGQWIYLDVFGSWCLPCRTKFPKMRTIARQMEEEGAAVLGLLFEDDPETAARWLTANGGITYPFAVLDDETARAWQLTGAPMGFLISPDRRIVKVCYGCSRGRDAVDLLPQLVR